MPRHWLRYLLLVIFLLAAALLLDAAWLEPSSIRLVSYAVPAPQRLKGLRVAVISDLHAGSLYIDAAKIDRIVAMANAARPDVIVLPGDYVSHRTLGQRRLPVEEIAAHLRPLHARLGVYAVLGNHDYFEGAGRITAAFARAGIVVLENRHVAVGGVTLAGIGFYPWHSDVGSALSGLSDKAQAICVTHSPDLFPELPGNCAVTIAGHTHGGQVRLPFWGRPAVGWIASRHGQRYAVGLIQEQGRTLFVSSGIGTTSLPLRFGVRPEISLLTLE